MVVSGHTLITIAIVLGVLDHEAGVIGDSEATHPTNQLSPKHTHTHTQTNVAIDDRGQMVI